MNEKNGSPEQNGFAADGLESVLAQPSQRNWIETAIEQHESSLLRYAQHFVHDLERARDVVQDTFLQLCKQTDNEIESRVAQWLFTVCRNRAIDVCRKEGRMKTARDNLLNDQPGLAEAPGAAVEQEEAAVGLMHQVDRLPDNQQEVLRLKFHAGLSYKEIADVTGLSKTNVGFLLHTAIAKLRERMVPG